MHWYMIGVLVVSFLLWLFENYLNYRQYRVYVTTRKVPHVLEDKIDDETFKKSKDYSIDKALFGFISSVYSHIISVLTLSLYLMPYFWDLSHNIMTETFGLVKTGSLEWEVFQSLVYLLITSLLSTVISLPVSIYSTFVIEQRHGFNKQTPGFYAWDQVKKFLLQAIITGPSVAAIIYIVRKGGDYFFLYLWMFCFAVVLVIFFFHGEIAALFDKFTPLPAGELRDKIDRLAKELSFPLANIFVCEGSKRSSHSNAYLSGFFNKKRIVIYDTLIANYQQKSEEAKVGAKSEENTEIDDDDSTEIYDEEADKENRPLGSENSKTKGCNDDEIIAVLCHELGHWWHTHLFKRLAIVEINFFFIFLLFSKLYNDPTLYSAFGFFNDRPVIIGLMLVGMILTPYSAVFEFIVTLVSRKCEYQADAFAVNRGHGDQLKSALVILNKDNLGFPVYDHLYSTFTHSHPTLIERIKAIDKTE